MSIGKVVMFVDVCIFDDNGEEVFIGEIGEFVIKVKNVMLGYWNKLVEIVKVFYGCYLLIGDLVKMDDDGDIFIIDCKKELIIIGGENVLLFEVENVLVEYLLVDWCVVVGYDYLKYGELIVVVIIFCEDEFYYVEILD